MEQRVDYNLKDTPAFYSTVQKRIKDYFKETGLEPTANSYFYIKAAFMGALYWLPLVFMLIFSMPTWLVMLSWVLIGFGMAGIGMNVMHDANHGSVSKNKWVNKIMGASMYLLAGNVFTWKVQHNVLHHNYTNVHGVDEDLDTDGLLRLHPEEKYRKIHRYQHWYATFLYGLLTINWLIAKDFKQWARYNKRGYGNEKTKNLELYGIIFWKITYFTLFLILPVFVGGYSWLLTIGGILLAHFIAGVTLSIIFQLAHVMPEVSHPVNENDKIEHSWATLQLATTANFATRSKLVTWFVGGLNYQIEHHLFPHISHVHYPKIAELVKETAAEMQLQYHEYKTFWQATAAHFHYLRKLAVSQPAMA